MSASLQRRDYGKCLWTPGALMLAIVKTLLVVVVLSYFFYRSAWAMLPLSAVGVLYFRQLQVNRAKLAREELTMQFKECILSVAASLKAGYAVENAFVESRNDMKLLYGEQSAIYVELEHIRRGLVINITLEELLADLAERSASEEILQFASVFAIAKKSGGRLPEIIQNTASLISSRIDAAREIKTLLSGRQMEQNIMKIMPFGILFYLGITYPGYFDSLYHNLQGVAIMTVCLAVYVAAYLLGDKILEQIGQKMK